MDLFLAVRRLLKCLTKVRSNCTVLYTCLKNNVILSIRNHYCALGLGVVETRFWSNIFPATRRSEL